MNVNFGGMKQQAADLANKVADKAKDFGTGALLYTQGKSNDAKDLSVFKHLPSPVFTSDVGPGKQAANVVLGIAGVLSGVLVGYALASVVHKAWSQSDAKAPVSANQRPEGAFRVTETMQSSKNEKTEAKKDEPTTRPRADGQTKLTQEERGTIQTKYKEYSYIPEEKPAVKDPVRKDTQSPSLFKSTNKYDKIEEGSMDPKGKLNVKSSEASTPEIKANLRETKTKEPKPKEFDAVEIASIRNALKDGVPEEGIMKTDANGILSPASPAEIKAAKALDKEIEAAANKAQKAQK